MLNKVKEYFQKDGAYKEIIKSVYNNPYSEKKDIEKTTNIDLDKITKVLNDLEKDLIILELNSQSNSNIESRVLKRIYLINPEIEQELEALL